MCLDVFVVIFFFKQKTAYEMRISDWSSDVCSSDLIRIVHNGQTEMFRQEAGDSDMPRSSHSAMLDWFQELGLPVNASRSVVAGAEGLLEFYADIGGSRAALPFDIDGVVYKVRSEEHTSELQSLMRISYAVFCLKKKKKKKSQQQ